MKIINYLKPFCGGRIIKTGLSVFLTAFICLTFELPVLFAVITAIVTTEPTASDSIKKGLIRFPASAIGAAVSLTFLYFFGESAITYTFAAVLTILFCYKLKLNDGILVATLTAVAMIPSVDAHFLNAFMTRLGTTSIGIIVSALINFLILPPNYAPTIHKQIKELFELSALLLEKTVLQILNEDKKDKTNSRSIYQQFQKKLELTFQLCENQRNEYKYHRTKTKDVRLLYDALKKLNHLQQLSFHLGNLQYVTSSLNQISMEEKDMLLKATSSMVEILKDKNHVIPKEHYQIIEKIDNQFWDWKDEVHHLPPAKYHHHFASHTILFYELLSCHDVLEELEFESKKVEPLKTLQESV